MRKLMIILIITLISGSINAEELAIQLHGLSYHSDRSEGFNEVNTGIGLRYYTKKTYFDYLTIGAYKNSEWNNSFYMGFGWETKLSQRIKLGLSSGIITGYERSNVLPYLVPSITFFDRIHIVGTSYPTMVMEVSVDVLRVEL